MWHQCQTWWAKEYSCVYHHEVEPEEREDRDDDREDDDVRDWPTIKVLAERPQDPKEKQARATVSEIQSATVPYVVAVEPAHPGPVISNWHGAVPNTGGGGVAPVLPAPPGVVFEPFQTPALVPPGGIGAVVPGGLPGPSEGGNPGNVFNPWDTHKADTPVPSGNVGRAAGIAIAALIVTAIVATTKTAPGPVIAVGGRLPPLPFFPLFGAIADYAQDDHHSELAIAERAMIDSINETALMIDQFQADYKERQLEQEQSTSDTQNRVLQTGPRLLAFNAIERFAGLQLPATAEFDWRSVGLSAPP